MIDSIPQVGSQDPERRNSPVAGELDEDRELPRQPTPEHAACYFNDQVFEHGRFVRSGTVTLRCHDGIWVDAGPGDPENP